MTRNSSSRRRKFRYLEHDYIFSFVDKIDRDVACNRYFLRALAYFGVDQFYVLSREYGAIRTTSVRRLLFSGLICAADATVSSLPIFVCSSSLDHLDRAKYG